MTCETLPWPADALFVYMMVLVIIATTLLIVSTAIDMLKDIMERVRRR